VSPSPPARPPIPWHRRLEARVLVSVTLVAGLTLLAVLFVTSRLVTNYAFDRSGDDLIAARGAFRRLVETRTGFAAAHVRLITEQPVFRNHFPEAVEHAPSMDAMAQDYCDKLNAAFCIVTDPSGRWIGRTRVPDGAQPSALQQPIDSARTGKPVNTIVEIGQRLYLTVSEPAYVLPPEVLGTFTVAFVLDDQMARELASMARGQVTFLCAGGRPCGSSLNQVDQRAVGELISREPSLLESETPTLRDLGQSAYVGGTWSLGPAGRLLLLADWSPTGVTVARLHQALLWVGLATFAIAIAGMIVFGRRLTRPLRDLASAADELAGGDWTRRMPVDGPAEARVMAEAFNQMTVAMRQREDQLRQAQKMEAVGRLAGGIAHDFNNLLTGILGYADLLYKELPSEDPKRADVDGIRKAGRSAAALTKQLLAFSRKQVMQPVVLDLNDVITGSEHLMRRLLGEDITLEVKPAADLAQIKADRAQLEQVLLNLAVNARDAMPGVGRLTISTENAAANRDDLVERLSGAAGAHVLLRVADTGHGMSAEVQAHLFEPFFTTKEVGKGTGLGLSTVYGVIKQSAGHIWAESDVGRGATFVIALPAVAAIPEPAAAVVERAETAPRGTETVLLVEDNDAVRDLARDTLRRFGYEVIEARNGEEALQIGRTQLGRISLLVTDLVMPLMGGRELAAKLTASRAELKVIFTSGYPADTLGPQAVLEPGTHFIQKPFTPMLLGQTVRDVLDAHGVVRRTGLRLH
jgi:signal transduction histidine kinase/CheY-like chemotaxis protein